MQRNNRYYLSYSASLKRAFSDCKRSIKSLCYWRTVEWRFRLKKMMGKTNFTMAFKHAPLFTGVIYDNEWRIESIADYYGYNMVDEALLSTKSVYKFALKKSKNP